MATKIDWKTLYTDLPEKTASILREARVKPEQLTTKTDGEIMAIEGLTEVDLETIRAKYPANTEVEAAPKTKEAPATDTSTNPRLKHPRRVYGRSSHYKALKKNFDQETLEIAAAVEKLQKLAKKGNSVDLHLNTLETGLRGEIKLPFSTGKTIRVEIFSDKTLAALNDGVTNFDVLLATPADMGKLARFAKILGPRGLMPNPKSGTVTENPEARAKQLTTGSTLSYKTEVKFPIIHLNIGKIDQKAEELVKNIETTIREIGPNKIKSAYLTTTQSPSIRLNHNI